jgi:hypothetical protein
VIYHRNFLQNQIPRSDHRCSTYSDQVRFYEKHKMGKTAMKLLRSRLILALAALVLSGLLSAQTLSGQDFRIGDGFIGRSGGWGQGDGQELSYRHCEKLDRK